MLSSREQWRCPGSYRRHVRHHDYRGGLYRVILSLTHSCMGGMLGWAGLGHLTKCSVCVRYQLFGRILSRPSRSSLPCLGASYESRTDYQRSIFITCILPNNGKIRRWNIINQYLKMYDKYDLLPFCTLDFRCYKQKC